LFEWAAVAGVPKLIFDGITEFLWTGLTRFTGLGTTTMHDDLDLPADLRRIVLPFFADSIELAHKIAPKNGVSPRLPERARSD
jgi:hypothetical protein